jgi:hypothetical protein
MRELAAVPSLAFRRRSAAGTRRLGRPSGPTPSVYRRSERSRRRRFSSRSPGTGRVTGSNSSANGESSGS